MMDFLYTYVWIYIFLFKKKIDEIANVLLWFVIPLFKKTP